MAVTLIGLREATKSAGSSPVGKRTYIVKSDAQITTDIDAILDSTSIPAYDAGWDGSTNLGLKVSNKTAEALDEMEGYYWQVTVNYATPTGTDSDQDALDPRDRPWDWSKSTDKYEVVTPYSLFDTAGYLYPNTIATDMVNLGQKMAIANTAGDPPEGGIQQIISRSIFTMTKHVDRDGYASIVSGATGWSDLDDYIDSINSDSKAMLDNTYAKWEMRCDDIFYEPISENGFDVMKVTITVATDTYRKFVFAFPSSGYNYIDASGVQRPIRDADNEIITSARLLDEVGAPIPPPVSEPYINDPVIVSAGINEAKSWASLSIPATIP